VKYIFLVICCVGFFSCSNKVSEVESGIQNGNLSEISTSALVGVALEISHQVDKDVVFSTENIKYHTGFKRRYSGKFEVVPMEDLVLDKTNFTRKTKDGIISHILYFNEEEWVKMCGGVAKVWVNAYSSKWDLVIYQVNLVFKDSKWNVAKVQIVGMS